MIQGLRKKKQTRKWLCDQLGVDKSWATRFINGKQNTIEEDRMFELERILDIKFFDLKRPKRGQLTKMAREIAARYDSDEAFAQVVSALSTAMENKIYTPRYIPPKEMSQVGEEIVRICYANEDKPGKVARLVLELLA